MTELGREEFKQRIHQHITIKFTRNTELRVTEHATLRS